MRTMEIQDLGKHISEMLEYIHAGEDIEIVSQDEVVARVVPVQAQRHGNDREAILKALADLDRLAAQIGAHWPKGVSAEDTVNDVRGDS